MRELTPATQTEPCGPHPGAIRWSHPKGNPLGANKYSYQNISCFFEQEMFCKVPMGSRSLPKNNEIVSATAYEKPPSPPPEGVGGGKTWLNSYKR